MLKSDSGEQYFVTFFFFLFLLALFYNPTGDLGPPISAGKSYWVSFAILWFWQTVSVSMDGELAVPPRACVPPQGFPHGTTYSSSSWPCTVLFLPLAQVHNEKWSWWVWFLKIYSSHNFTVSLSAGLGRAFLRFWRIQHKGNPAHTNFQQTVSLRKVKLCLNPRTNYILDYQVLPVLRCGGCNFFFSFHAFKAICTGKIK